MEHSTTIGSLSPSRRRLAELMRYINFGQIECLHVRCGEPCFTPPPIVFKDFVFGKDKDNGPSVCCHDSDFVLKKQVIELFECLEKEGDCIVQFLIVQNGLPFKMRLQIPIRA